MPNMKVMPACSVMTFPVSLLAMLNLQFHDCQFVRAPSNVRMFYYVLLTSVIVIKSLLDYPCNMFLK